MTEHPDPDQSPEIEQVRRLLAEARHTEPMPEDVAARMDDVLAGLRDAATTPSAPAPTDEPRPTVVSLASRRRRRVAGGLVAAAAIVVGGVTLGQHLPESSNPTSATSGGEAAAQDQGARTPAPHDLGKSDNRYLEARAPRPEFRNGRLVVHPHRFASDALAGRHLVKRTYAGSSQPSAPCAVPSGNGDVLDVTYRQAPAALVYRPASGNRQVVELYVCGNPDVVRTATLPAP